MEQVREGGKARDYKKYERGESQVKVVRPKGGVMEG